MEDYRVKQTGDEIQEILNQSPLDTADIAGLKDSGALLDGRLENVEEKIPVGASAENHLTDKEYVDGADTTLQDNIDAEETRAKAAEQANASGISAINGKIPAEASAENKLVDNATLQSGYYTIAAVDNLIQAIGQKDIIVGELPSTGVANTIYRVPGDGEYSDYMWYDGTWQLLATYSANTQGYQYIGIATPTTNPGTPTNNVFYFAHDAGTYTNFDSLVVTQGINILKFDGTAWTLEQAVGIDDRPTALSEKLVKSGGVWTEAIEQSILPKVNLVGLGGNNNASVTFKLPPNKVFKIKLSKTTWDATGVNMAKFSVQHVINDVSTADVVVQYNETAKQEYVIETTEADYYFIGFRAAAGETLTVALIEQHAEQANIVLKDGIYIEYKQKTSSPQRMAFAYKIPVDIERTAFSLTGVLPQSVEIDFEGFATFEEATGFSTNPIEYNGYGREMSYQFTNPSVKYVSVRFKPATGNTFDTDDKALIVNGCLTLNLLPTEAVSAILKNDNDKYILPVTNTKYIIHGDGLVLDNVLNGIAEGMDEQSQEIEEHSQEIAKLDEVLSVGFKDEETLIGLGGNNNTAATLQLIPGKKYRFILSKTTWDASGVNQAKFSIQHAISGVYTADVVVQYNETPMAYYDIVAVKADHYLIGFRAASGEELTVRIVPFYSNIPLDELLDYGVNKAYPLTEMAFKHLTGVKRIRCTQMLIKRPVEIHVNSENVPSGMSFSIMSSYSLADAQNPVVSGVEDGGWNGNDLLLKNKEAVYVTVGFKKNDNTSFSDADIETLLSSDISIYADNYPYVLDKPDTSIIAINNEAETLLHLRNAKTPEYSDDGSYTAGTIPLTLLHFSDIHADGPNTKRIVEFAEYYSDYIDDTICTGDIIKNTFGQSFTFWADSGADNILNCTGNHEYYNGESTPPYYQQITSKQVYDKFFSPYINEWGVVQPSGAAENGLCYYYKDYTTHKVRLVVLDNMRIDAAQANWLADVLADAKTNGLHVVCAIHIGSVLETQYDNSWNSLHPTVSHPINAGLEAAFETLLTVVDTFIANGGIFVGWIQGHRHKDTIGVFTNHPNQLSIHIATASSGNSWDIIPKGDDCDRTDGTKSQDCLNLYSIDTYRKRIRIHRVGCDLDRDLRHKGNLCYDYENMRLIYSD